MRDREQQQQQQQQQQRVASPGVFKSKSPRHALPLVNRFTTILSDLKHTCMQRLAHMHRVAHLCARRTHAARCGTHRRTASTRPPNRPNQCTEHTHARVHTRMTNSLTHTHTKRSHPHSLLSRSHPHSPLSPSFATLTLSPSFTALFLFFLFPPPPAARQTHAAVEEVCGFGDGRGG